MSDDRVALVTGGGSGLGAATARALARGGAKVAVLGRTREDLETVASDVRATGTEAMVLVADIADDQAMKQVFADIAEEWGRLDVVFANAGINGVWAPLDDLDPDEWRQTIDVNLNGTFFTIKYAVPYLERQGGSVIVTSSVNGTRMFSNTGATAYACTKAAQVAMVKMLALELAKHRIRVNVICPGAIESDIEENTDRQNVEEEREPVVYPEGEIPLTDGVPGMAEDVAELVAFLASDASKHITGTEVWIDGGQSLLQG